MYGINVSCCFRCVNSGISIILLEEICYMIDPVYSIVTLKGNKLLKESIKLNWYKLIKFWRLALTKLTFTCSKSTIETLEKVTKYVQI